LYTGCQQYANKGETQLRRLTAGSIILFGSNLHGAFVLDTVFVIRDSFDHDARNYRDVLRDVVPAVYKDVTLEPWYADPRNGPPRSFRLYRGVTFDAPLNGMFSFSPCATPATAPNGFARPTIMHRLITPTQKQKFKLDRGLKDADAREIWDSVVRQVLGQGLALGISAALPTAGCSAS